MTPDSNVSLRNKSMLFHEMLHLLGHGHSEDQLAGKDMPNLPVHTACQACCFPEDLLSEWMADDPKQKAKCLSYRQSYCDLRAGATGTTADVLASPEFQSVKANDGSRIKECYKMGNPF